KKRITNEVEKRWPRGSALPIYRNKADAIQVDKFEAKLVKDDTHLFPECGFGKEAVLETVLNKIWEQKRQQKEDPLPVKKCCQQTVHLSQTSQPSPVVEILFHLLIHLSCNICGKHTTFILMKVHDRDHSRFNCNDGSRKTILKRSEDRSITEDEKKSSILAFYKARTR
ncbi:hypothetical protein pdam_00009805, partial [Pocillopora damicornis]